MSQKNAVESVIARDHDGAITREDNSIESSRLLLVVSPLKPIKVRIPFYLDVTSGLVLSYLLGVRLRSLRHMADDHPKSWRRCSAIALPSNLTNYHPITFRGDLSCLATVWHARTNQRPSLCLTPLNEGFCLLRNMSPECLKMPDPDRLLANNIFLRFCGTFFCRNILCVCVSGDHLSQLRLSPAPLSASPTLMSGPGRSR